MDENTTIDNRAVNGAEAANKANVTNSNNAANADSEATQLNLAGSKSEETQIVNEETKILNEQTQLFSKGSLRNSATQSGQVGVGQTPPPYHGAEKKSKSKVWKNVGIAAGAAAGVGAVVLGLSSFVKAETPDVTEETKPEWLTGDVKVAEVSDDMSFDEAFKAAREQVGPGGAFEWHGKVYGTYTGAEWNAMSTADRAEWSQNFNWSGAEGDTGAQHAQTAHTATHTSTHTTIVEEHHVYHEAEKPTPAQQPGTPGAGSHTPGSSAVSGGEHQQQGQYAINEDGNRVIDDGFEVIGVTEIDQGSNLAVIKVNGDKYGLIDLDGDTQFDLLVVDENHDGVLSNEEVANSVVLEPNAPRPSVASLGGYLHDPNHPDGSMGNDMADASRSAEVLEGSEDGLAVDHDGIGQPHDNSENDGSDVSVREDFGDGGLVEDQFGESDVAEVAEVADARVVDAQVAQPEVQVAEVSATEYVTPDEPMSFTETMSNEGAIETIDNNDTYTATQPEGEGIVTDTYGNEASYTDGYTDNYNTEMAHTDVPTEDVGMPEPMHEDLAMNDISGIDDASADSDFDMSGTV